MRTSLNSPLNIRPFRDFRGHLVEEEIRCTVKTPLSISKPEFSLDEERISISSILNVAMLWLWCNMPNQRVLISRKTSKYNVLCVCVECVMRCRFAFWWRNSNGTLYFHLIQQDILRHSILQFQYYVCLYFHFHFTSNFVSPPKGFILLYPHIFEPMLNMETPSLAHPDCCSLGHWHSTIKCQRDKCKNRIRKSTDCRHRVHKFETSYKLYHPPCIWRHPMYDLVSTLRENNIFLFCVATVVMADDRNSTCEIEIVRNIYCCVYEFKLKF